MFKVGNYLYHPQRKIVIKVTNIFDRPIFANVDWPWIGYDVIVSQIENDTYSAFSKGSSKHNGWDYTNIIGNEFILLHKYDKDIPLVYRILYGS